MTSVDQQRYKGGVRVLIADLGGTVVDYGSCAPAGAFVELFQRNGVEISEEQAREPMGLEKKDHIRTLTRIPDIERKWKERNGSEVAEDDIEKMYQEFIPLQLEILPRYSRVIPGVLDVIGRLVEKGIRLGVTTGYNREMMEVVLKEASRQGLVPDSSVCASDVPRGRPAPWMILRSMEELDIWPPATVVKIGDTIPDIEAGLNAGVWTIGVSRTGNMLGLDEAEASSLPEAEMKKRLEAASEKMLRSGAHYVIHGFSDCLPVLEEISRRLASSERP